MEKEQDQNLQDNPTTSEKSEVDNQAQDPIENEDGQSENYKNSLEENNKNLSPEDKIKELEDKLTRSFAEMENQRRSLRKKEKMLFSMEVLLLQKKP